MSSKKRRSKNATPDPAQDETKAESGSENVADRGAKAGGSKRSASAKTSASAKASRKKTSKARAKAVEAEAEEPKAKRSLPAFGFAGDLLKKKSSDEASMETPSATSKASPSDADTELAQEPADDSTPGEGGTDDADPHRIFSFADQLQHRQDRLEEDQGPEARWETWVTFSLDEETFALPVEPVRQVVRVSNITRVPHAPRPVRGVTNLRGRVIPVIDLRMRVGLDPSRISRHSRVVAVASRGRLLGLLVDAVHQVVHLDLNQVQPPPEDVMTIQSDYILGVYHQDDSLVLLLDVDRALVLREEAA